MKRFISLSFALIFLIQMGVLSVWAAEPRSVLLPSRSSLVSFRILFMTGSADDPKGKEGLASMTAAMVAESGTKQMTYQQILEALYPMASSLNWQVDKEMTVFAGTTHLDNLEKYRDLLTRMILAPGFRGEDFTRIKADSINALKVNLRESNDEELAKEHLYNIIYKGHPYGHHNIGTVSSLEKLTLDDVLTFYKTNYTQSNLVIGLSGGYPSDFAGKVRSSFAALPEGKPGRKQFEQVKLETGIRIEVINRETRSTAISLGFPIDVRRGEKDWAALALAVSYFGQHRSSNSYLYQRIREARGLNYGDYAYIEYFPGGMFQFIPNPNLGRQQQIFQIWIRPVEPQNGPFALRAALYELDRLVRNGMSKTDFEATREFLTKYSSILTETQDNQLGYALDSSYYGIPDFNSYLRQQLAALTLEDVNKAIKTHLKPSVMRIVVVAGDGEEFRKVVLSGKPTPVVYTAPKPKEITDEDKVIEAYKIDVKDSAVTVVPAASVFQ